MARDKAQRRKLDPDITRRDDAPYWAAALVLAVRAGEKRRVNLALRNLHRLGFKLFLADGEGVADGQ